jgi:hypothetical protein
LVKSKSIYGDIFYVIVLFNLTYWYWVSSCQWLITKVKNIVVFIVSGMILSFKPDDMGAGAADLSVSYVKKQHGHKFVE